jgi:hypothetical protein
MDQGSERDAETSFPIHQMTPSGCRLWKLNLFHSKWRSIGSEALVDMVGGAAPQREISQASKNLAVRVMGNNGENMDTNGKLDATGNRSSMDSYQETEYRLASLRSLVCDLLKTNQELRDALKAKIDVPRS